MILNGSSISPVTPSLLSKDGSDRSAEIPPEILVFFPNTRKAELLAGGAVNQCFKVELTEENVAFRLGVNDPSKYGFDRHKELQFYKEAENLGLAPRLRGAEVSKGILVMSFIEGDPIKEEIKEKAVLEKVVQSIQLLHTIKAPSDSKSEIIQRIHFFIQELKRFNSLPSEWEMFIDSALNNITFFSESLVLCHNDLAYNLLLEKGKVWMIDWECAGWNYPIFDLAILCLWYEFSQEEKKQLLTEYYGNLEKEKELDSALCLGLLFSALWSQLEVIYAMTEEKKNDYQNQARELFKRAKDLTV